MHGDADGLCSFAEKVLGAGDPKGALELFRQALEQQTDHAPALRGLGLALSAQGKLDESARALASALQHEPGWAEARQDLEAVRRSQADVQVAVELCADTRELPLLDVAQVCAGAEQGRGAALAIKLFERFGVLALTNLLDPGLTARARQHYLERYSDYFSGGSHADALDVGDRRVMVTVDIEGPFADPALYANAFLLPILEAALGEDYLLAGFGSVAALPGSEEQHLHTDHPGLFGANQVSASLPCYAVTVAVPLVDLTEETGTTRVYPGTHLFPSATVDSRTSLHHDAYLSAGSCLMWDYRLMHQGTANRGDRVRPLLYNVYSRPWFRDAANYIKQEPIRISAEELERVPESLRFLLRSAPRK